ncbi:MAG TPA: sigma-70 family RNA polymerase sigma factor [Candidatus Limnocylindria bacterium]|nr:sigma-70 family RNA polymerase sigma factor [Candidatus Limnocylindria bacterium]
MTDSPASDESTNRPYRRDIFATTRWSLVVAAGSPESSPLAGRALDDLCRAYWYPLYVHARRRGNTHEDAQDLVQGFFARFLGKNYLEGLKAERGRFRAFLLAAFKHYDTTEFQRASRQKRGGGVPLLSLDWDTAEGRYRSEPIHEESPDRMYDRTWALAVLERVIVQLEAEFLAAHESHEFQVLKPYLMADRAAVPYAEAAARLEIDENTARVAVHRLRQRYRRALRQEIQETLSDPANVDDELQSLFRAFG